MVLRPVAILQSKGMTRYSDTALLELWSGSSSSTISTNPTETSKIKQFFTYVSETLS